jgi:uncharacterized protein involved in exopolysaccharide biosynthesis
VGKKNENMEQRVDMSNEARKDSAFLFDAWLLRVLPQIIPTIRQDLRTIVLTAVIVGLVFAYIGYTTRSATSTAQLVVVSIPLQSSEKKEKSTVPVVDFLPMTIGITTAGLLCKSDEVLQKTLERLNSSGKLSTPIRDLRSLQRMLDFEVTTEKETPYEVTYSPIIQLMAKASKGEDAKIIVDTWAEVCQEQAKKYQQIRFMHLADVLRPQSDEQERILTEAEQRLEDFWKTHNIEVVQQEINSLVGLTTNYIESEAKFQQDIIEEKARISVFQQVLETEKPTIPLRWIPSGKVLSLLAQQLGVSSDISNESNGAELLLREEINTVNEKVRGEVALSQGKVGATEARLQELRRLLKEFDTRMQTLMGELAQAKTLEKRLNREVDIASKIYNDVKVNYEMARIAEKLQQPDLQILAYGAEWPTSRVLRPASFAVVGFAFAFLAACFISVFYRLAWVGSLRHVA